MAVPIADTAASFSGALVADGLMAAVLVMAKVAEAIVQGDTAVAVSVQVSKYIEKKGCRLTL